MRKKNVFVALLVISFLGCDEDFKQGSCDDGFYEQALPQGGTYCVPINDQKIIENPILSADFEEPAL